jgi:4-amino-4-deoxy-L-arabinose transferase-like glycosyltransferase
LFTTLSQYLTLVFPIVTLFCLFLFFRYYLKVTQPLKGTTEWITRIVNKPRFTLLHRRHPMERRDLLPILIITLVYAAVAFFKLGNTTAPQSFYRFTGEKDSVVITLTEPADIDKVMYYTGLWTGFYTLEFSHDGSNWVEQNPAENKDHSMNQPHSDLFKWLKANLNDGNLPTSYIRITASKTPMELGEIAIYVKGGGLLSSYMISSNDAPQLFDEQDQVPDMPTYMTNMYFDEIYHGRTAYEHLNNIVPYETTHPPLGKLIISVGIAIFGMVPFGWRFMGTLFGVLMLPVLYVFLKNMFGKTPIAACGTILFGFDFMHYVQTRIATIDTYGVFFILLSYFFMYRYITRDPEEPFNKGLPSLGLSGLFFGIGCASKWIVIYAGVGLLVLYLIRLIWCWKYYKDNELNGFKGFLISTLLCTFTFFVIVPAVVYCLSYIQNGRAAGMRISEGMLWDPRFYQLIWNNQTFMFGYHAKLVATHSYGSVWWQWITDGRPILYYREAANGIKSSFASFGNPIVWWGGFLAIIAMGYRSIKFKDSKALFILIGYFVQLAPWLVITRVVFIYHYFPCVLFMTLALSHVLDTIWERAQGRYKLAVYGFTGSAVLLFGVFFPVLSGVPVSEFYTKNILRWIPQAWPF